MNKELQQEHRKDTLNYLIILKRTRSLNDVGLEWLDRLSKRFLEKGGQYDTKSDFYCL